jgi:tripartite ATP-independent transporter DctM subunit
MVPGVVLALIFIITIYLLTKINPAMGVPGPRFGIREKMASLKPTWSLLLLFCVVIGGLYAGWLTPTEAAGAGAFGAFVVIIIRKRLTWKNLIEALKDTTSATAMIFAIIIGAMIFQFFMTMSQIPNQLAQSVVDLEVGRYMVISFIILAFIVMGCFMEGLSLMVLAVPIVFPIVIQLGFDPIWFGIIITLTMEMSLITPPVGVNVFVLSGVARDVPMYTIFRGIVPFWVAMLACIIILMIFPEIVLFLPERMM